MYFFDHSYKFIISIILKIVIYIYIKMKHSLIIFIIVVAVLVFIGLIGLGMWVKIHNTKIELKEVSQDTGLVISKINEINEIHENQKVINENT